MPVLSVFGRWRYRRLEADYTTLDARCQARADLLGRTT